MMHKERKDRHSRRYQDLASRQQIVRDHLYKIQYLDRDDNGFPSFSAHRR